MEPERFPISIRLTGILHKDKTKMYIMSVLWSDQNDIVVYRSFNEFRGMHKQLKKKFPSGSKINKYDRILPKFQTKQKSQGKGPYKSLVRLKHLQKYCYELLSCHQRVSQSAELLQFLQPKEKELMPEFTKNSIMIIPSEDEIRSFGTDTSGNVTQPFVTETYRCVASYETKDTKNKPFKVAVDEKLDILIKDRNGWWLVENEDKRMAWFPAPYLVKLEDEEDEEEMGGTPETEILYTVVKSYSSTVVDEVCVNIGAVVSVLRKSDNGWWLIRIGYIPSLNLKPYIYPRTQLKPQHDMQSPFSLLAPSSPPSRHHHSYGELSQPPNPRPNFAGLGQMDSIQRSQSLNRLSEEPYARPAATRFHPESKTPTTPTSALQLSPPVILVQNDEEAEKSGGMFRAESVDSFESDSFSDDGLSMSAGSTLSLSYTANDQQLRLCSKPTPVVSNHLSPTSHPEGTLLPIVSDPNLYKGPRSPKVPPRPQTREILTRCSTVTRKKATKSNLSPEPTEETSITKSGF